VAGVGHSIGATILLALAGGQIWTRARQKLAVEPDRRLEKLALLTPVMAFFQAPGALDAVRTPIKAWAGSEDDITPAAQIEAALRTLTDRGLAELRIADGAGHFSFMNQPPPQVTEPLRDRDAFLAQLTVEIGRFIMS
jgi:predicted dienelactone hydrolase